MSLDYTTVGAGLAAVFTGWQSYRANKQTKATGNGFAKHTAESLAELKELAIDSKRGLERVEGKIDRHIEDHAESDLRR